MTRAVVDIPVIKTERLILRACEAWMHEVSDHGVLLDSTLHGQPVEIHRHPKEAA